MNKSHAPGRTNIRWWICLLIFFATTINYLDRQILALLKPVLDVEMHWNNQQFGVINASFQAAYALGLLFFGWFIDRRGVKVGYATSIVLWSLAAISHAFASTVSGFLGARVFLGLSEAGNFPAGIKTIAQWFPKQERAFATALFNSGANIGAILAPIFVPLILLSWSWHAPFIMAGTAGFVWVTVWWCFYASPAQNRRVSSAELAWIQEGESISRDPLTRVSWRLLMRLPQTWSFVAAKFLTDPVWYFFLIWLPDFFKKTRGLDLKSSWLHLVAIYSTVTVLSLIGGWVTGHLVTKGWSVTRARKTGLFCFALFVLPILAVSQAGDWSAVILIGVAGAAHQAWSANLYTTVSDMFPDRAIASVIGFGSTFGAIGSMIFTVLAGHILDQYGLHQAQASYRILFGYCGCAYLLAFVIQHLLAPKFEPLNLSE